MDVAHLNAEWDKVKIELMSAHNTVFLSSLVFSLKLVWDTGVPTAATNGLDLRWNPDWFLSLTKKERLGVTVHEACHVAFDHIGRAEFISAVDFNKFAKAADHAINLFLKKQNFELPAGGLWDSQYEGMSTEQIYQHMKEHGDDTPSPWECFLNAQPPKNDDGTIMTPAELKNKIQDVIVRAAMQSEMRGEKAGNIPGEVEAFLHKLRNPEIPWTQVLMRKLASMDKQNYNFKKPRRRYMPHHFLPDRSGERVKGLDAYIDISGSVADYQFSMFIGELAGVMKTRKPEYIRVIQFDTRITEVTKVRTIEELKAINFHGRGGTDVYEVFEDIKTSKADLHLIFTDGGFHFRDNFPKGKRVLWLINDNPSWKAEQGDVIHFSTERYAK